MIDAPAGLTEELEALFAKHRIDPLKKADVVGQLAAGLRDCHVGNTLGWMLGGLIYAFVKDNDVIGILKRLVAALDKAGKAEGLNYNDGDCDLRGRQIANQEDEGVSWVIHYGSHGHDYVYAVRENGRRLILHIRKFPYNTNWEIVKEGVKGIATAIQKNRYDDSCPLMRCWDSRDEGFILSLTCDKAYDKWPAGHKCEASFQAVDALNAAIGHFPWVIENLGMGEKGEL